MTSEATQTRTTGLDEAISVTDTTPKPNRKRRMAREPGSTGTTAPRPASSVPPGISKIKTVIALLGRDDGATLEEMMAATGWLPHTVRAALTGLRKKGHAIEKSKRGDVTCWHIVEPA